MGVLSFYRRESDLGGRKLPRKPRPLRRRSEPCSRSPVLNSLPSTRNLPRRILLQALEMCKSISPHATRSPRVPACFTQVCMAIGTIWLCKTFSFALTAASFKPGRFRRPARRKGSDHQPWTSSFWQAPPTRIASDAFLSRDPQQVLSANPSKPDRKRRKFRPARIDEREQVQAPRRFSTHEEHILHLRSPLMPSASVS